MKRLIFNNKTTDPTVIEFKGRFKLPKLIYKFIQFIQLHRILSLALAILIFLGLLIPIAQNNFTTSRYKLNPSASELLGSTSPKLAAKISYDSKAELYQYNKQTKTPDGSNLPSDQSISTGDKGYSADLYKDPSKGITLYDTVNNLSVSFTPQFKTLGGKQDSNRFIYPINGRPGQMIFTAKANGIKEDIILDKYTKDKVSYDYKLKLNDDLEARLNDDGSVGIYSADPTLFGNISFGSEEDKAKVEAARKNGQKNNLVFSIPAPIINQANPSKGNSTAKFKLDKDTLTLEAENLKQANYPLSIDPTFIVTSASDWKQGNNEGGVDTSGNDLIRAGLTGGTVGSWTQTTGTSNFTTAREANSVVAYNGYLYTLAGIDLTNNYNDVQYAPLNSSTGAIGAWQATTSFANTRNQTSAIAYNGYMYIIGGSGATILNDVQYAKINSNGTLGSWAPTSSFTTARYAHTAVAYNGYMYLLGGCSAGLNPLTCSTLGDTQYAKVNGDGTVGSWASTNSFTTARANPISVVYNGYLYLIGGASNNGVVGTVLQDVQFTKLNSDGTTTANWRTTTTAPISYAFNAVVANGYLYATNANGTVSALNYYAQINADGTIGTWRSLTNNTTARYVNGAAYYNGYIYVAGGCTAVPINSCGTVTNTSEYAKIDPAGSIGSYSTITGSTVMNTARTSLSSAALNGYIYAVGGSDDGSTSIIASVEYASINSDGTLGTFANTTSLNAARTNSAIAINNGTIYITGGCSGACTTLTNLNDTEYATPSSNGTISSWTRDVTHTFTARQNHRSAIINNYLYVMGGCVTAVAGCSGYTTSVQVSQISSSGTLGNFSTTSSLPNAAGQFGAGVAVNAGYIYLTGGCNLVQSGDSPCTTAITSTYYAKPNSDGTIPASGAGSWQAASTSFTTARFGHATVISNGMIYIVGGANAAGSRFSDTQFAPILNSGDLGSWNTTQSLPANRAGHAAVTNNGFLYVIGGGASQGSPQASYTEAQINNGGPGTLGGWTVNSNNMVATTQRVGVVAVNGQIVIEDYPSYQYATINSNGSLGTFTQVAHTTGRSSTNKAQYYNGRWYAMTDTNVVYSSVLSIGTPLTYTTGTAFPGSGDAQKRGQANVTIYNGYIYVVGGCAPNIILGTACTASTTKNTVIYAQILGDGSVGSWTTASNAMAAARLSPQPVVVNGYMYVFASCADATNTAYVCPAGSLLSSVEVSQLDSSTGVPGPFQVTTSLPWQVDGHFTYYYNGYMYVAKGDRDSGSTGAVAYAPVLSSGKLGNWSLTTRQITARTIASFFANNGTLYNIGGCVTSTCTFTNTIEYASLQSIPRIGKYSRLFDCEADCTPTKLQTRGSLGGNNSTVSNSYACALNSTPTFGSTTNTTLTLGNMLTIPYQIKRYCWLSYTLDDTQSAVFPDSNQTSLSDFNLYYHAASSRRLRGGKTFTGGNQQSLDAQP